MRTEESQSDVSVNIASWVTFQIAEIVLSAIWAQHNQTELIYVALIKTPDGSRRATSVCLSFKNSYLRNRYPLKHSGSRVIQGPSSVAVHVPVDYYCGFPAHVHHACHYFIRIYSTLSSESLLTNSKHEERDWETPELCPYQVRHEATLSTQS